LRLGFLPFFLILILYEKYQWALLVLFVSAATDALDGLLARSLDQKSALGAYLDPIADKLLLSSSFIVLRWPENRLVGHDPGDQPRCFVAGCGRRHPDYSGLSAVPAKFPRQVHNIF